MEDQYCTKFPIGMRILAVDENPAFLQLLVQMLHTWQYEVTTTNSAAKALTILRKDRNQFDLVITDVKMADMDGFELLQHVRSEMDLPVILLSEHNDKELVIKGLMNGASLYLSKPVRVEELRNIWQYVLQKDIPSRGQGRAPNQGGTNDNDRRTENCREQSRSAEEEDSVPRNDDSSTTRRARVVWCLDLHEKFVAAVKQLGVDRAVPRKILELMNVEGLTRENVASHLQKFRIYLKKSQSEEQAHMLSPLAARSSSWYMRMSFLDIYGDRYSSPGTGRLPRSFGPGGSFDRLNSPSALSSHGIGSSGLLFPQTQSLSSSTSTVGSIQPPMFPTNLTFKLFEGGPSSLELNNLQQTIITSSTNQLSPTDLPVRFTVPTQGNGGGNIGSSNNDLMFQGNTQQSHDLWGYGSGSSNWHGLAPPHQLPSNSLSFGDPSLNEQPALINLNISSLSPPKEESLIEIPSANTVSVLSEESGKYIQSQDGLLGGVVQATTYMQKRSREENKQDCPPNPTNPEVSSPVVTMGSSGQNLQQPTEASLTDQLNGDGATPSTQSFDVRIIPVKAKKMKQNEDYVYQSS